MQCTPMQYINAAQLYKDRLEWLNIITYNYGCYIYLRIERDDKNISTRNLILIFLAF